MWGIGVGAYNAGTVVGGLGVGVYGGGRSLAGLSGSPSTTPGGLLGDRGPPVSQAEAQ